MPYLRREPPNPEPIDCRILTAALDLFVENGYHNVSIHEVQKNSEVSIGSIYKHFGGKEGVAKALYNHILGEIDELVVDVLDEHQSPTMQMREIIRQLFQFTETHKNIIAFAFHAKHPEFLPEEPLLCHSNVFTKLYEIVKRGVKLREFKDIDPMILVSMILGPAVHLIQLRIDGMIEKPLSEYLDTMMDSALHGVAC